MTLDDVKSLMMMGSRLKLRSLRYKDLQVDYGVDSVASVKALGEETSVLTEDELLYWSTDYTPPIKAEAPE